MRNLILFTTVLLIGCSSQIDIDIDMGSPSETEKFHSILEREWKKGIINNPEWATRLGDNRFNDKLNDESYETIAGFVLDKIQRIPAPGEMFRYQRWKIEVVETDRLRVSKVRLTAPPFHTFSGKETGIKKDQPS